MVINNKVNDIVVKKACDFVISRYSDEDFLDTLKDQRFLHTEDTGADVAKKIEDFFYDLRINIVPYKTWNPLSKVIGYAEGNTIYINTRKLDLDVFERTENIFHECLHLIGYSHKGNRVTKYNLETVPYKAARLFKEHLKGIYGDTLHASSLNKK